jgi:hypothetical protein
MIVILPERQTIPSEHGERDATQAYPNFISTLGAEPRGTLYRYLKQTADDAGRTGELRAPKFKFCLKISAPVALDLNLGNWREAV